LFTARIIDKKLRQFFYLFCKLIIADEAKESNTPKINAHRKPSMWIPETNLSARITINTLMIKRKIPNVRIVMGSVKIISSGFTIVFNMANTITKISAVE
jgi:hypothetical protein